MEQESLLRGIGHHRAPAGTQSLGHLPAAKGDPAGLWRQQPDQQIGEGGFAGARSAGNADEAARHQRKIEPGHALAAVGMAIGDLVKAQGQIRRQILGGDAVRGFAEVDLQPLHRIVGRQEIGELMQALLQLGDRRAHAGQQQHEDDQLRRRHGEQIEPGQDGGGAGQRGDRREDELGLALLAGEIDLARHQPGQGGVELPGEAALQILAHRQFQPAEELRATMGEMEGGVGHLAPELLRLGQLRQQRHPGAEQQHSRQQSQRR